MAKIHEEAVIIKVSKLVKQNNSSEKLIDNDTVAALEQVAQELFGEGLIVEVERVE